jgi:hypothetical protein
MQCYASRAFGILFGTCSLVPVIGACSLVRAVWNFQFGTRNLIPAIWYLQFDTCSLERSVCTCSFNAVCTLSS